MCKYIKITESEIRKESLKFVQERYGFHNLMEARRNNKDIDSHRKSFEFGVKIYLEKIGFKKEKKYYLYNEE